MSVGCCARAWHVDIEQRTDDQGNHGSSIAACGLKSLNQLLDLPDLDLFQILCQRHGLLFSSSRDCHFRDSLTRDSLMEGLMVRRGAWENVRGSGALFKAIDRRRGIKVPVSQD